MTEDDNEVSYLCSDKTPLHWAVIHNDCEQLKILLQNGEDPNIQDGEGNSPLHYLLSHNSGLVEILVNYGANVDFQNNDNKTPLHSLVSNKDPFVKDARLKSVKMLLEKGANVNSQDCRGLTPLHDLVYCELYYKAGPSEYELCDLLLGYGANVQLQDLNGYTPLHLAVRMKSSLAAKLLESTFGKNAVNIPNKSGDYPLHTAVCKDNLKGIKLLLDNGARINCENCNGHTALHLTTSLLRWIRLYNDSGKLLLQIGAEVNSQDKNGRTPLSYAANLCVNYNYKYIHFPLHEFINMLLDWGASFGIEGGSWKRHIDSSPFYKDQKKYEIRKTCLGSPPNVTKKVLPVHEFQSYEKGCRTEVNKMKAERHGNISLYDIFNQQFDPLFLWNEDLVSTLRSKNLDHHYPIYASLLSSTYHRSKERVQLFDSVSTILQTPLPLEMIRYFLSFVDNDSLRNAIKAKDLL